jgi:hypothetical protein
MRIVVSQFRILIPLLGILTLSGCASPGASEGSTASSGSRSSRSITVDELAGVMHLNALEAVEQLRPNWLRTRGAVTMESSSQQGVRLYIDGNPSGFATETLAQILVSDVHEMRYMNAREATTRYGTGFPDGLILLTTGR